MSKWSFARSKRFTNMLLQLDRGVLPLTYLKWFVRCTARWRAGRRCGRFLLLKLKISIIHRYMPVQSSHGKDVLVW